MSRLFNFRPVLGYGVRGGNWLLFVNEMFCFLLDFNFLSYRIIFSIKKSDSTSKTNKVMVLGRPFGIFKPKVISKT